MTVDHATANARRSDRILNGLWRIEAAGDIVEDGEKLCVGARQEALARWPFIAYDLTNEDILEHLLEVVVAKAARYRPSDAGSTLSGFLYHRLPEKVLDLWRHTYGRHGQRRPFAQEGDTVQSPGQPRLGISHYGEEPDLDGGRAPGFPGAFADPLEGGSACVGGLYAAGDRRDPRAVDSVGRVPGAGAEGDVAGAVAGAGGGGGGGAGDTVGGGAYWRDCECGVRHFRQAPNGDATWHWPDFCTCGRALSADD